MIINQNKILKILEQVLLKDKLDEIRLDIDNIERNTKSLKNDNVGLLNIGSNGHTITISQKYLNQELKQIKETHTIERTKYYVERLIKTLSKVKTNKINDQIYCMDISPT
jgi:DNA-binding HxlR family transcriptional regulator